MIMMMMTTTMMRTWEMIIHHAPEAPPPNLNPADMPVEEPRASNPKVAEADDGWVVVASKRNRCKRN